MSVYVDAPVWPYRQMLMCHMLADTEEELHEMAAAIGVARKHFQNDRYPHYDICKTKRRRAVILGAIEITRKQFVTLAKQQRI